MLLNMQFCLVLSNDCSQPFWCRSGARDSWFWNLSPFLCIRLRNFKLLKDGKVVFFNVIQVAFCKHPSKSELFLERRVMPSQKNATHMIDLGPLPLKHRSRRYKSHSRDSLTGFEQLKIQNSLEISPNVL